MKKLYIVLTCLLALSCRQKQQGVFEIKGEILHAPGKKVLLVEAPYTNDQPIILDSAFLSDKGSFALKGRANEEGIYRLVLENGPYIILVNDGNAINIHIDINNYRGYRIEGSPASESLHRLFEEYSTQEASIQANFKSIDSLQKSAGKDSSIEALKTRNDKQVEDLNSLVTDFIKNSNSPAAVAYAMGIASQSLKPEVLKPMVDDAAARFPAHKGLARIKTMLAITRQQPEKPAGAAYPLLYKQAPDLTMNDVDGKPLSISSFRGKYLLVDFWASWCGPCRQENPNVVAAFARFKNKNFTILGVSLDQDKGAWQNAIAKDNLAWHHMSDLKQWQSEAVSTYSFEGIPFNVLIDPSGKIIASGLRGEDLQNKLEEVLH